MKLWNAATAVACTSLLLTAGVRAEEPAKTPAAVKAAPAKAPAMDPKAIMDAYMKMATPGDAHKWIAKGEGTWDAKVTMFQPGQPPAESAGTMEAKMKLDGRWL